MHAQFITAEELLAQGEEENRLAKIEYERRHQAMAIAVRSAELQAKGWEPWNAKARAESEVLLGLERAA